MITEFLSLDREVGVHPNPKLKSKFPKFPNPKFPNPNPLQGQIQMICDGLPPDAIRGFFLKPYI